MGNSTVTATCKQVGGTFKFVTLDAFINRCGAVEVKLHGRTQTCTTFDCCVLGVAGGLIYRFELLHKGEFRLPTRDSNIPNLQSIWAHRDATCNNGNCDLFKIGLNRKDYEALFAN